MMTIDARSWAPDKTSAGPRDTSLPPCAATKGPEA